jgi:hypothetical protein
MLRRRDHDCERHREGDALGGMTLGLGATWRL